jgi:H+/Cl- antiporter ClcA
MKLILNFELVSHWVLQFKRNPIFNRGARKGALLNAMGAGIASQFELPLGSLI